MGLLINALRNIRVKRSRPLHVMVTKNGLFFCFKPDSVQGSKNNSQLCHKNKCINVRN